MSIAQYRLLAVCAWLLALCFGIAFAAFTETYFLFAGGPRAQATVTEVRPREDGFSIGLSYAFEGRPRDGWTSVDDAAGLVPGGVIEVALHANNGEPILATETGRDLPTIGLLFLGVLASIAGGVALWVLPARAAARRRESRKSRLDAVVHAAARTRNVHLGTGVLLLVFGALFALVPFADDSAGPGGAIFLWALAAITIAVGLRGFWIAARMWDPTRNDTLDLIVQRPDEIAWVYVQEITTNNIQASASLAVWIWKTDGKSTTLTLVREDLDDVLAEIAARAPHAQQGYDAEIQRLYRERPDRWRPVARTA